MARILVADDNADIRAVLEAACRLDGHDVSTAASGREAIALYCARPFDLLLLDMSMPGGGAAEILSGIAESGAAQPRAIVVSGHGTDQLMHPAVVGSIAKPFAIADLRQAVATALAGG